MMDDDFISAGEPIPRLASVQAGAGKSVLVTWEDGTEATIDLSPHIEDRPIFAALVDDEIFADVELEERGVGVFWPRLPLSRDVSMLSQDNRIIEISGVSIAGA